MRDRRPPTSRRNRSSRLATSSTGVNARTRDAASSIASGRQSSRRHSSLIAADCSASITRSGASVWARSRKRRSASASASDVTGTSRSPLTINGSRLVARTVTHGHAPTSLLDDIGDRRQHVLAVVDDDQRALLAQPSGEVLDHVAVGRCSDPQARRERERHRLLDRNRGELDEPAAVREHRRGGVRNLDRHARLAGPADTEQGHQPALAELLGELRDLRAATDERRQLDRDVAEPLAGDSQVRKVLGARPGTAARVSPVPSGDARRGPPARTRRPATPVDDDTRICPP